MVKVTRIESKSILKRRAAQGAPVPVPEDWDWKTAAAGCIAMGVIEQILKYDAKLNEHEDVPTGDDYNEVVAMAMDWANRIARVIDPAQAAALVLKTWRKGV